MLFLQVKLRNRNFQVTISDYVDKRKISSEQHLCKRTRRGLELSVIMEIAKIMLNSLKFQIKKFYGKTPSIEEVILHYLVEEA